MTADHRAGREGFFEKNADSFEKAAYVTENRQRRIAGGQKTTSDYRRRRCILTLSHQPEQEHFVLTAFKVARELEQVDRIQIRL